MKTVTTVRHIGVLVWVGLLMGSVGCQSASQKEGWRELFNGKNLKGWQVECKSSDRNKKLWKVEDGSIVADSMGQKEHDYVWLVSKKSYSDFELRLKFQAYRDSPGNSGVQIRSRFVHKAQWLDGPQIDINPRGPWRTGMIWDETRGSTRWLWPEVAKGEWVNQEMAAEGLIFYYADEGPGWNDMIVTARGTNIKVVLNGVTVADYDGQGVLDDDVHQLHQVGMEGQIALQIHRGDQLKIRFKDISIRELIN